MQLTRFSCLAAFVILISTPHATGHSWVDDLYIIAPNGSLAGDAGYIRGIQARASVSNPDLAFEYQLSGVITSTDPMCRSSQTKGNQLPGFPSLKASPGDFVALRYGENGHVTQPTLTNRGLGSGIVFVYGTSQPSASDTYLGIHRVWNAAGTNSDGSAARGQLLAVQYFDDGVCHQFVPARPISAARAAAFATETAGTEIACQTDLQLPANIRGDSYTLYWVWEWPLLNENTGAQLSNESYTSCMDININNSSSSASLSDVKAFNFATPKFYDNVAIPAQVKKSFVLPSPYLQEVYTTGPLTGIASPTATAPAISASSPTVSATPLPTTTQAASQPAGNMVTITETITQTAPAIVITVTATASSTLATTTSLLVTASPITSSAVAPQATSAAGSSGIVVTPFMSASARKLRIRGRVAE